MIAANNVALAGQGFNSDDNALTLFTKHDKAVLALAAKTVLAKQLVAFIEQHNR